METDNQLTLEQWLSMWGSLLYLLVDGLFS